MDDIIQHAAQAEQRSALCSGIVSAVMETKLVKNYKGAGNQVYASHSGLQSFSFKMGRI